MKRVLSSVLTVVISFCLVASFSLASVAKAEELLGWRAKRDVSDMCRSTWHWQSTNPYGYDG